MRIHCFGCKRFAKDEDCTLKEHKESGIRRWFHKSELKAGCMSWLHPEDWFDVDRNLGETTDEELKTWKQQTNIRGE